VPVIASMRTISARVFVQTAHIERRRRSGRHGPAFALVSAMQRRRFTVLSRIDHIDRTVNTSSRNETEWFPSVCHKGCDV
jgi:hypothetical protein